MICSKLLRVPGAAGSSLRASGQGHASAASGLIAGHPLIEMAHQANRPERWGPARRARTRGQLAFSFERPSRTGAKALWRDQPLPFEDGAL